MFDAIFDLHDAGLTFISKMITIKPLLIARIFHNGRVTEYYLKASESNIIIHHKGSTQRAVFPTVFSLLTIIYRPLHVGLNIRASMWLN
jgi:hypothetical protein